MLSEAVKLSNDYYPDGKYSIQFQYLDKQKNRCSDMYFTDVMYKSDIVPSVGDCVFLQILKTQNYGHFRIIARHFNTSPASCPDLYVYNQFTLIVTEVDDSLAEMNPKE